MKKYKRKFNESERKILFVIIKDDLGSIKQIKSILGSLNISYEITDPFSDSKETFIKTSVVDSDIVQKIRNARLRKTIFIIEI